MGPFYAVCKINGFTPEDLGLRGTFHQEREEYLECSAWEGDGRGVAIYEVITWIT